MLLDLLFPPWWKVFIEPIVEKKEPTIEILNLGRRRKWTVYSSANCK